MFLFHTNTVEKVKPGVMLCGIDNFFLAGAKIILDGFDFWTSTTSERLSIHYFNDATLVDLLISLKRVNASHRNVIFCGEKTFSFLRGMYFETNALILPRNISVDKLKEELDFWLYRYNHRISSVFCSGSTDVLTPTEWRIIVLFCAGLETEDISIMEEIKIKTVSTHKRNAMHKLCSKTNQDLYVKVKLLTALKVSQ